MWETTSSTCWYGAYSLCAECGRTCPERALVVMAAYDYCLHGRGRARERALSWQFKVKVSNQFRDLYTYQHHWHDDACIILHKVCSHPDRPQPWWNKWENTNYISVHTNLLMYYSDHQFNRAFVTRFGWGLQLDAMCLFKKKIKWD